MHDKDDIGPWGCIIWIIFYAVLYLLLKDFGIAFVR